jgi:hypothetical protein
MLAQGSNISHDPGNAKSFLFEAKLWLDHAQTGAVRRWGSELTVLETPPVVRLRSNLDATGGVQTLDPTAVRRNPAGSITDPATPATNPQRG